MPAITAFSVGPLPVSQGREALGKPLARFKAYPLVR
jgi:hypothetical protein